MGLPSCSESISSWPTSHSQHEILDFLGPDTHRLLTFVLNNVLFSTSIVLNCHIIMGGYEGQRGRLPFIQINYQPYFANRNWRSRRKNSGRLSSSLSPSQTCFFPVNGSYSAIGNIGSLNSGKRVGADDNYRWPLKGAQTEEYRRSSLPWSGMQVKTNKITIETESMGVVLLGRPPPPPDTRFASDIFVYKQGLGGRSTAAHGIDPHRMVHRGAVLVGAPVC